MRLNENYKAYSLLHPIAVTATTTHAAVEMEQKENDAMFVLNVGAVTGTTPTLDVTIEATENGTDWVTVLTFAQVIAGDKLAAGGASLNHVQQVRAKSTVGGTTPSFTMSIEMLIEDGYGSSTVNSLTAA